MKNLNIQIMSMPPAYALTATFMATLFVCGADDRFVSTQSKMRL